MPPRPEGALRLILELPEPQRADLALLEALRARAEPAPASRSALKEWFRQGRVLLHGRPIEASFLLRAGRAELEVLSGAIGRVPARDAAASPARGAALPVVYEDESLLVLHKPSGIPSLPQSPAETETAVGHALARDPALVDVARESGRSLLEPGLLHRLDTGTSGLLAFARTGTEWARLREAWKAGRVRKTYRALCRAEPAGTAPPTPGLWIERALAHDAGSSKRMVTLPTRNAIRGKPLPAKTRVLAVEPRPEDASLELEVEIHTGVMHQIRCHLASLGWPILGDPIYRGAPSERLWLHAWRLEIPLARGTLLKLEAALPSGWTDARP